MKIGTIKIRPVVLVIALSMGISLIMMILLLSKLLSQPELDGTLLAAVIAFGGQLITGIVGVATKLIESEEQSE